ncbi:MAG: hypothetical protein WAU77_07060 [Solirubrobacteraceae bacterium]
MALTSVYGSPWDEDAAGDAFVLVEDEAAAVAPVLVLPGTAELEVVSFSATTVDVAAPTSA